MEKILPISLKLNFTPNTLGCYGLSQRINLVQENFRGRKHSLNPLPPSDAVRKQKKCIIEDLLSSLLSQFK